MVRCSYCRDWCRLWFRSVSVIVRFFQPHPTSTALRNAPQARLEGGGLTAEQLSEVLFATKPSSGAALLTLAEVEAVKAATDDEVDGGVAVQAMVADEGCGDVKLEAAVPSVAMDDVSAVAATERGESGKEIAEVPSLAMEDASVA